MHPLLQTILKTQVRVRVSHLQDTLVANEIQGDFGHSALASSGSNETTQPTQDTSEVPVPSVTENDTVERVANTEHTHKKRNCLKRAYIHSEQGQISDMH